MKYKLWIPVCLTFLVMLIGAFASQARIHHPTSTRWVYGHIAKGATEQPVPSVKIHVLNDSIGSVSTNAGNFKIQGVPGGVQQMVFEHPCFLPIQVTIPAEGDVSIALGLPYNPTSERNPGCGDVARPEGTGDLN